MATAPDNTDFDDFTRDMDDLDFDEGSYDTWSLPLMITFAIACVLGAGFLLLHIAGVR